MIRLRAAQFREDAGPLAHPVRPEEYIEINNFYTATVYEKGAEVIGMLRRLVGPETYARALDLYFERHDGQACTIEDWLAVFEDASGRDLAQFKLWYSQAGTPRLSATERWDGARYRLDLAQETPPTPGQPEKAPAGRSPSPTASSTRAGADVAEGRPRARPPPARPSSWDLPARPVPSLLRGFSAPVILERATYAGRARLPARPRQRPLQQVGGRPRLRALTLLARLAADPPTPTPTRTISPRSPRRRRRRASTRPSRPSCSALPSEDEVIAHIAAAGPAARPAGDLAPPAARLEAAAATALAGPARRALRRQRRPRPLQPRRRRRRPPRAARPRPRPPHRARPGGDAGARALRRRPAT